MAKNSILRRGRFERAQDKSASRFLSSIAQDEKILEADLWVDKAHVLMLNKQGIIGDKPAFEILRGLDSIASTNRELLMSEDFEDVHILIESKLIERLGEEIGGRIHTARSRNDEVAACIRVALREDLLEILESLIRLQETILNLASDNLNTIMPGFTHLQHAEPTTLAHHLISYAVALQRDALRLRASYEITNVSPLGAGAMASTSFPIDPEFSAQLLGFDEVTKNSIDAVASRDFLLDTLSSLSILGVDISRLAEELVLWSTAEFGFIQPADEYSSTSSIMPQKRNPDVAELIRGRISSIFGSLFSSLTICKGLPLSYNGDLQEATVHLWQGTDTMKSILTVLEGMLSTMEVKKEAMERALAIGQIWATDLANLLVTDFDLPFRTAHSIIAEVSKDWKEERGPEEISLKIAEASKRITGEKIQLGFERIREAMDARSRIKLRRACGGPAPSEVRKSIHKIRKTANDNVVWIRNKRGRIATAREMVQTIQATLQK